jgi:hypothetical protein
MKVLKSLNARVVVILLSVLLVTQLVLAAKGLFPEQSVTRTWSWAYRPQTLRELYDLSDMIIVGTVANVKEGPQWVGKTTAPEHPTVTVDSMLIEMKVTAVVKGRIRVGDTLTIYRLVNVDENTHSVGENYLVFLRPRLESVEPSDGSHFIFAAEGNYHVVEDRLVWDWQHLANDENSFAASELDGARLDRVLEQVESLD